MNIKLNDILQLSEDDIENFKVHIAVRNTEGVQPLDVFLRDEEEWKGWTEYKTYRNDWNRKYVFTLIQDYHRTDKYLFGGVFVVKETLEEKYVVELSDKFKTFVGRLVVDYHQSQRQVRRKFEEVIDDFLVYEILDKKYSGIDFPGYDDINIDFDSLEDIIRNEKNDWKVALENIKGVYLIVDKSNGKKYVGSAYGNEGIWSRWSCYIDSGHGGNDELVEIINEKGIDYARKNFKFSLLEIYTMKTDTESIIYRESFWKEVLLTRGNFGYNKN